MSKITFADIVTEELQFNPRNPSEKLILKLTDTKWVQRLRDISQTGNTRLVYMFSEHSRFGHSLGVAYLAVKLLKEIKKDFPKDVSKYELAIAAAALLHDIAHLAPGSHTAQKVWFPDKPDMHEEAAAEIIAEDQELQNILEQSEEGLTKKILAILKEDSALPPWTWQIISGGGWNVDRGNWCIADSILAGVSYGKYNIAALTNSITLSKDKELALKENRLDAMLHFAVSRHAMYKQIYQHRVLLAADRLTCMIVKRCRDIQSKLYFADDVMQKVIAAKSIADLNNSDIFIMREAWWRYHLLQWTKSKDSILADLSTRLLNRELLKTVAILPEDNHDAFYQQAKDAVLTSGFNPEYYLSEISSVDRFVEDSSQTLKVLRDNGEVKDLKDMDSIFQVILQNAREVKKDWLVMPEEAKKVLGRKR